jgi:hypothetical protein
MNGKGMTYATWFLAGMSGLLGEFVSMAFGFTMLLVAFVWMGVRMANVTTKSYSAHQRIDAIVPVLASTQSTANSAQSTANSANTTANNVQSQVGGLSIPQTRGGGMTAAPTSYNQTWGNSVVSEVTQINSQLQAAGVFV